jgi:predicted MPP superfamily phosphohydrolase
VGARGFFNTRDLQIVKIRIALKRLPPAFEGIRIGQITDIHAGPLVSREMIDAGVRDLMASRPDLIVLTGDFVSGATRILWTTYGGFKPHHLRYCMEALGRLSAPLGVFAVLGNHDFWSGKAVADKIVRGLEGIGVRVLRNESASLEKENQAVHLIGVDDYWEDSFDLTYALREVPEGACAILLSHNPDVNEHITRMRRRVDLVISGHTHGGQIVLPYLGAPYLPSPFGQKYRAGLVADGERQTYVSRGLGLFFAPVRLNCPPDVTLITLSRPS